MHTRPHLVDVVGVDARVKAHVKVVEHLDHLERRTGRGDGGEAHDVGEEYGHLEGQTGGKAPAEFGPDLGLVPVGGRGAAGPL